MASIVLSWPANPANEYITGYEVWGADGTGIAFGSCTLLATVNGLTWTNVGMSNSQARTYYLRAVNFYGVSVTPAGPLNIVSAPIAGTDTIVASEALSAGDLVNLHTVSGAAKMRKANATDETRPADGFVKANVSVGAIGEFFAPGAVNDAVSGLTPGSPYYLDTTAGGITTTPPSTDGNVIQYVGEALSAGRLLFEPERSLQL